MGSRSSWFLLLCNHRFGSPQRLRYFEIRQRLCLRVLCGLSRRILDRLGSRIIALILNRWRRNLFRRWALRECLFALFLDGVFMELFLLSPRWYWHIITRSGLHRFSLSHFLSPLLLSSNLVFLFLKLLFSQFDFLLDCSFDFGLYFALCLFVSFSLLLLRFKNLQLFPLKFGILLLFFDHELFRFLDFLSFHSQFLKHLEFLLLLFEFKLLFLNLLPIPLIP